jgi:calcium-binding protein CML
VEFVRSNEVLYELLQTNQPVGRPTHAKRKSIIEQLGFEVTNKSSFDGRIPTARHRTEPKKTAYKKTEERDMIIMEIVEIFNKRANNKGKILVRDLFDIIRSNPTLSQFSDEIISECKFRLTSEVNIDEVKLCLVKRRNTRVSTQLPSNPSEKPPSSASSNLNIGVLKEMFDRFDINKDGTISLTELKKGLKDKFSPQSIEEMFREYDFDGNGCLDFNEFVRLFSPDAALIPNLLINPNC